MFVEDCLGFKGLVVFIISLLLAHLVCIVSTLWQMSVVGYCIPEDLTAFPSITLVIGILGSIINLLVQAFYIYRLTRLSGSWFLPSICSFLATLSCAFGLLAVVEALRMSSGTSEASTAAQDMWEIGACLALAPLADVVITASLVYYMKGKFTESGTRMFRILKKSVAWAIETGLITSLCSLLVLIFFLTMEQNNIWSGSYGFVSSIYANCFLALLNGRSRFRHDDKCLCKCYPVEAIAGG
ncbi:hypothetical protein CONPUDRAFT_165537, partial [Coniophora puteana RWD-64-598 SS2]